MRRVQKAQQYGDAVITLKDWPDLPASCTTKIHVAQANQAIVIEGPSAAGQCDRAESQCARLRGCGGGLQVYNGITAAAAGVVQQAGVRGLYRGLGVTLLEIVPYSALNFGLYDGLNGAYNRFRVGHFRRALPGPLTLSICEGFPAPACTGDAVMLSGSSSLSRKRRQHA